MPGFGDVNPATNSWVRAIKAGVEKQLGPVSVEVSSQWAKLIDLSGKVLCQLVPAGSVLRVFLRAFPSADERLERNRSDGPWASRYPSVFAVTGQGDIKDAVELIAASSK